MSDKNIGPWGVLDPATIAASHAAADDAARIGRLITASRHAHDLIVDARAAIDAGHLDVADEFTDRAALILMRSWQ